jgi:hypothetical protein
MLVDVPITALQVALEVFVLVRFGLLAIMITFLLPNLTVFVPITLKLSYWYGGRSLFVLLFIVALALCAFRMALAGRPVFGRLAMEDL